MDIPSLRLSILPPGTARVKGRLGRQPTWSRLLLTPPLAPAARGGLLVRRRCRSRRAFPARLLRRGRGPSGADPSAPAVSPPPRPRQRSPGPSLLTPSPAPARCLATRRTHRSRHDPESRCPALVAAALPQGPVVLHARHTARPHPPPVRVRRGGPCGGLTQHDGIKGTGRPGTLGGPLLSGRSTSCTSARSHSSVSGRWVARTGMGEVSGVCR